MLTKFGLLSVNQLAAQIKLIEVWKATNVENYALILEPYRPNRPDQIPGQDYTLRPRENRIYNDSARLQISKHSFNVDAARLWNLFPPEIRNAATFGIAKSAIANYAKSLPV